jgi:hypothetical protein
MAGQLGGPEQLVRFRGACQQQGLLHLFKLTCAARVCERCPAYATTHGGPTARWLAGATKEAVDSSDD